MEKTSNKIAYLDGIRGLAAFLVFIHHFLLAFFFAFYSFDPALSNLNGWEIKYGKSVFSFLSNGNFCVCIFFVLSGFVLSKKYFQTGSLEVLTSGANRRFIRLYVPIATTLIIAFIMIHAGLFFNVPVSHLRHSEEWFLPMWDIPDSVQRLWTCLKASTMFMGDSIFDTSLWTMAIEFSGSMFVFAFLALTHYTNKRFFALALVFLYCCFTRQIMLSTFVLGISLNYLERVISGSNQYIKAGVAALLLPISLILGSYPTYGSTKDTFFEHLGHTLLEYVDWYHAIGAYFLVLAFVLSALLQRFISMRLFRFLGYISFSFYLLHPLIIGSFSSYLYLKIYTHLGYNVSVIYTFVLSTVVCVFFSWLMTKYVDEQGIRLSKYVYERWFKKENQI